MEYRTLGKTGLRVSVLGFGASPLGGVFGPVVEEDAVRAVHSAIDRGINLFDVAPYYGLTRAETALGRALRGIPRDRFIVATKVGRYGAADFDFTAERILRGIDESLKRLQVDAIDIITCHDVEFVPIEQAMGEALPALDRAREQGKVRFLGVSGLPLKIYHTVLDRDVLDTVLTYCHFTLNDSSLAAHLPYLEGKGVGIINASPYSMGLLTGMPLPEWHPAPEEIRSACRKAADYCRARGMALPHVALRHALSEPRIASTLTGMRSQEEVEQNIWWMETAVDPELAAGVSRVLAPIQGRNWTSGLPENN